MRGGGMIVGFGLDLVKVSRFHNILRKHSSREVSGSLENSPYIKRFSQRILHPEHELPKFNRIVAEHHRIEDYDAGIESCSKFLAGSWASKEAAFKTLIPNEQQKFVFKDWYKENDGSGAPRIHCHNYQVAHPDEKFFLSISHDADLITAGVIRVIQEEAKI